MEIDKHGCEESRREQSKLHAELAQRERARRETHIRSIHEVEELKRAQELRFDEFSRKELKESQATFNELASPIQELQESVNFMNDSWRFHDVESAYGGRLHHVPSQPAVVRSLRSMPCRDQSLRPDTSNLLGTSGNVFGSPPAPIDSVSTPKRGMMHPWNPNATFGDPVQLSTGRPVAGNKNRDTLPTPRFARRPSTRNSLFPAEGVYPQNWMVDQQRH